MRNYATVEFECFFSKPLVLFSWSSSHYVFVLYPLVGAWEWLCHVTAFRTLNRIVVLFSFFHCVWRHEYFLSNRQRLLRGCYFHFFFSRTTVIFWSNSWGSDIGKLIKDFDSIKISVEFGIGVSIIFIEVQFRKRQRTFTVLFLVVFSLIKNHLRRE